MAEAVRVDDDMGLFVFAETPDKGMDFADELLQLLARFHAPENDEYVVPSRCFLKNIRQPSFAQ